MELKKFQRNIFFNIVLTYILIANFLGFILILYTIKMSHEQLQLLVPLFVIIGGMNLLLILGISFYLLVPITKICREVENGKSFDEKFISRAYDKLLTYPYKVAIFGPIVSATGYLLGTFLMLHYVSITYEQAIKGFLIGLSVSVYFGLVLYFVTNNLVLKLSPKFTKFIPSLSKKKVTIFYKILGLISILLFIVAIIGGTIIHTAMQEMVNYNVKSTAEKNLQDLNADLLNISVEELKQHQHEFTGHSIGSHGYIFVTDTSGKVLVSSNERAELEPALMQEILKNKNFENFDAKNQQLVVSFYSENHNAIFVSVADLTEFYGTIYQTFRFIFFAFLVVYLISFMVVVYFANSVSEPIIALAEASKSMLSENPEVKYVLARTGDEVGELAATFNKMLFELNEHRNKLEKMVSERTEELNLKIKESDETKKAIVNMMDDIDNTNKTLIEAQVKLKENLEELKILDKKKNEFVSMIAHELKTPITSIKGFVEIMTEKFENLDPEARKKYFEIIHTDTERLNKLISDILDLTKLDLKTLKLDIGEVSIAELFKDLDDELGIIVRKKGLEFIQEIDENAPKSVVSDKGRLLQILSNLTNNAMHYTEKGSIKIMAALKGDTVRFSVADTGMGIPSEYIGKLFQRFYQVDSSYTRKIGGSGLGLAICRGLTEVLGGKIWLESTVSAGTTFYFTIPIKAQ